MSPEVHHQHIVLRDAETGEQLNLPQEIEKSLHTLLLLQSQPLTEEKVQELNVLRLSLRERIMELDVNSSLVKLENDYLFSFLRNSGPLGDIQQQYKLLHKKDIPHDISALTEVLQNIHLQFLQLQHSGFTTDTLFKYWRLGTSTLEAITENESSNTLPLQRLKTLLDHFDEQLKSYDVTLSHLRRVTYETWLMARLFNNIESGRLDKGGKKAEKDK